MRDIEAEYEISQARATVGCNPTDAKLKDTSCGVCIKTSGSQPYSRKEENATFHTIAKERGDCEEGPSRPAMRTDARQLVQAIGEGAVVAGLYPKKCKRLLEAMCGAQWLTDSKQRAAGLAPTADFRKASAIRYKRAALAAPERNEVITFDNIEAMYAELFEECISETLHPKLERVEATDRPCRTESPCPCIILVTWTTPTNTRRYHCMIVLPTTQWSWHHAHWLPSH